jgi:Caspase recruitment domain
LAPLAKDIRDLKKELKGLIETDYGLLNELLAHGVLDREQVDSIRNRGSVFEQCDFLLDTVVQMSMVDCERFLEALRATDQDHVVQYILLKGRK